jgi:DNA-binding NtrC family response regulator
VRIIASTNRNLAAEIAAGRFREDLFYRLAVVPLELPPLRAREGDVLALADYFLDRAVRRLARPRIELTDEAKRLLAEYHWPGNVRELENLITRACVLNAAPTIDASDFCPWLQRGAGGADSPVGAGAARPALAGTRLEDMERAAIVATLRKFDGNRARTAAALGIGVRTLSGKLRSYGYAPRTREFASNDDVDAERQELPAVAAELAGRATRRIA